jgi:hypothetical protein
LRLVRGCQASRRTRSSQAGPCGGHGQTGWSRTSRNCLRQSSSEGWSKRQALLPQSLGSKDEVCEQYLPGPDRRRRPAAQRDAPDHLLLVGRVFVPRNAGSTSRGSTWWTSGYIGSERVRGRMTPYERHRRRRRLPARRELPLRIRRREPRIRRGLLLGRPRMRGRARLAGAYELTADTLACTTCFSGPNRARGVRADRRGRYDRRVRRWSGPSSRPFGLDDLIETSPFNDKSEVVAA